MEIVVTGYAGLDGSRQIYAVDAYREKLLNQYSERFFHILEKETAQAEANCKEADKVTNQSGENADRAENALQKNLQRELQAGKSQYDVLYETAKALGLSETGADGGVLRALWDVLKRNKLGGVFSQRAIPVRQETVELCEFFGLNPYRLEAGSLHVILTEEAGRLLAAAKEAGRAAAVIGYTEKTVAIRRTDGAEIAFLRRPEPDELNRMI